MRLTLRRLRLRGSVLVLAMLAIGVTVLIGAGGATAGPAVTTNVQIEFTGWNTCVFPAEHFVGSGHMQFIMTDNASTSGNVSFHLDVNTSGLTAITDFPLASAGKKYTVIDQEGTTDTFDLDGAPSHETVEHTFELIRTGEDGTPLAPNALGVGDDLFEHLIAHITANANGIVTVDDYTVDTRCK